MSVLSDFYKANNVTEKEQIRLEKNILMIVPDKEYDLKPALNRLGLSRWEVAVTYPKEGLDMFSEIISAQSKLVVQVGTKQTKKFAFLPDDGSLDETIKNKIQSVIADEFVNLHHHDEYSIKDGLGTVDHLIKLLKAQRRSFCCITNHGSVGGWIKQYNACKKHGIKAIFGMEAYTSPYRGEDPEERKKHRSANHLVLIAKTMEGFENIIKIHNDSQMNGFYYTPRANRDVFKQFGKGIVSSTACLAGEIPQLLMAGEKEKAKELYEFYKGCFDEFYIEIQIIEYEAQREANRKLIEFAKEVGAPLVLDLDSHYLEPEHSESHDVLMCVRQHKTLFDEKGDENSDLWSFDVKNMYYRNLEEIRKVFDNGFVDKDGNKYEPFKDDVFTEEVFQEAVSNTRKIAVSTEDIKLDSTIKLPRLYDDGAKILKDKVNTGFKDRMLDSKPNVQVYLDRIAFEYDVITKLGWADYFLVMEKIITDTKAKFGEWSCGWGRGSAAGSLVSFVLGLTDIDPIQYGLLFERFLDSSRPTPPDIDTDFDPRVREWVKDHIVEMFGEDHVCSIGTYQTYRTKAVILDVVRALNEDLNVANEVTKKIDSLDSFEDDDGEEKKVDKLTFDELCGHYPELKAYFDNFPTVRHHAEILRNQVKNMGTHAGGVIISDINLKGRIPVLYDKPGNPEERKVISAWAEAGGNEELSSVGLVKFDILGLSNLPIISDCIELIKQNKGVEISKWEIPIDDGKTIRLASKKDLVGIFQLDSPATKPVADKVEMESLLDVAAVTSLIRPGPRDMKMDMEYARRKHGEPYEMPSVVKNLLLDTYGVMVFQEDIMRIAQKIGGFSSTESYKFLKICAKKQADQFPIWKDKFIKGSQKIIDEGSLTVKDVEVLVDQLAAFANYGFNKSVDKNELVACNGKNIRIGDIVKGDRVFSFDGKEMIETEVVANHDHGILPAFEVKFEYGEKVVCSIFHKFETKTGKIPLWKLLLNGQEVYCFDNKCLETRKLLSARFVGFRHMCDLEVSHTSHNFALANGIITSNSHAVAYSAVSTAELWLKFNYPTEYLTALINNSKLGKKKHGEDIFIGYVNYARHNGIEVLSPDVSMSLTQFAIWDGKILFSLEHIKNVASMAEVIMNHQPFTSIEDFHERVKAESVSAKGKATSRRPNKRVVETLIESGAFDKFGPGGSVSNNRNAIVAEYYRVRADKKDVVPTHTDEEWITLETEAIGLCLSQPPLFRQYEELINKKGWRLICQMENRKRVTVFGKIESIVPRTSKTGNPMYMVTITDGLDNLTFFVFKSAQQLFKDNFKIGSIAALPLSKFDEGDMRFYDDKKEFEIVKK